MILRGVDGMALVDALEQALDENVHAFTAFGRHFEHLHLRAYRLY